MSRFGKEEVKSETPTAGKPCETPEEESETLTARKFDSPDELSDITLVVKGTKLHVHKSMLEFSSPVFRKMLSGNFKEGTAGEIPLPDNNHEAFVNFLHQIYPDSYRAPIQDDTLEDMLALADKYQVEFLVKRCADYLKKQASKGTSLTVEQTMMYLYLCHKYTHHLSLWDEFGKLAVTKDYREVEKNEHFQQLPDERRIELLNLRCKRLESARVSMTSGISHIEQTIIRLAPSPTFGFGPLNTYTNQYSICHECNIDQLKSELEQCLREINININ